jgi:tripartite-type tricarboxylate transporter receptor subunit TctC
LIFSGSQHVAVPAMHSAAPYEPIKGFEPITLLFHLATLVSVPADLPANTLAEMLALGRTKPGGLSFGSPGAGSPSHLLAARIGRASNTPMQFVHYRGGGPMMADLITGRVDFALSSYTVARSQLAEKTLRALAIDAERRWSAIPDVPTLTELGFGNEKVASWFGVAAPAGTPPEVVNRLHGEFLKAARAPDVIRRLGDNGTPIATTTPEQMATLMAEEWQRTGELVRVLGLKQD